MLRWLIVVFLALIIFSGLHPWLFGREWFIPITSTLLLSMLASVIAKWL
jgi:hypothetical protein